MKRLFSVSLSLFAIGLLSASAAMAEVKETAHIVVTGGSHAGTYDASSDRGGCTYGLAAPGAWGNQLSSPKEKDPKKFNSLQLIVPGSKKAAAGTHEFYISIGFGSIFSRSAEYKIETRSGEKKSGSGVVTVLDKGTTGKVTFDVTSADGVKISGSIDCKSVIRNGN